EEVIRIKGKVSPRPKKTENPRIPTGLIEVSAIQLDILSQCSDLPFPLEDNLELSEEVKLSYRYLDLRRPNAQQKLITRHHINQAFREFLNSNGFLEIETPFLTKSTPEGARDYLVPSRLNPGKFYALPQSPQLFKQLLMVSGMDKYYQVVRCFRDEDLRKDRQPEFTQLDIEASFVEEEDIYSLTERMFEFVFKNVLNIELSIPFSRMSYKEAMDKHGTDKPDLRKEAEAEKYSFVWITDFPLFEFNDKEKRWQPTHHPFTSLKDEDIPMLDKDLSKIRSRAYDLVLNGEELGSGSVRIHSLELQKKIFKTLGIPASEAEEKFGFLLKAFNYGVPPHGGIAFGLDRLCAIISGSETIREVIAFPKTQKGICLLSGAPSPVSRSQMEDLSIGIIQSEEKSA
ncbi:MAG: aspartate--tRNA ligase, partial [Candidatus Omnitrophica bacterium]|nr:aspartate--tRNA ligase [Candidatus Omnitrophota bacterium]MBD3269601.1 aspartate--tRNA ligase [Candidatus Omnitrophota bacterium]